MCVVFIDSCFTPYYNKYIFLFSVKKIQAIKACTFPELFSTKPFRSEFYVFHSCNKSTFSALWRWKVLLKWRPVADHLSVMVMCDKVILHFSDMVVQ